MRNPVPTKETTVPIPNSTGYHDEFSCAAKGFGRIARTSKDTQLLEE